MTGRAGEKSRVRYANQFVVYQNGKGELSGLMADFKLLDVEPRGKAVVLVPTTAAWEFARLPNPVLDEGAAKIPEKFSSEERLFLIDHILKSVPAEAFAYKIILDAVRQGHTSPDRLDSVLKGYLGEDRAKKLSQSFLSSQRSGAISRMADIGLVERRRDGVRVSYVLTQAGEKLLDVVAPGK
jgi:hypothetical protein